MAQTLDSRLKTFQKRAHKKNWPHKTPSKISLARAFFSFDPAPEAKDCVVCSECGARFSGWQKEVRPIERHIGVNTHCFVAQLAAMSARVYALGSIESAADADAQADADADADAVADVKKACLSSFVNSGLNELSETLAANGFYYMAHKEEDACTVGCVACLCFPQQARGNPQHSSKCALRALIARSSVVRKESVNENGTSQENGKTSAARASAALGSLELACTRLPMTASSPKGERTSLCDVISSLHNQTGETGYLLGRILSKYEHTLTVNEINRIEVIVLDSLQRNYVQNVNIIRTETERVISKMLQGADEDLKVLAS